MGRKLENAAVKGKDFKGKTVSLQKCIKILRNYRKTLYKCSQNQYNLKRKFVWGRYILMAHILTYKC